MKEGFVTVCLCLFLVALGFGFMYFVLELDKVTVVETVDNSVENCEHDWVVSSEYSVWGRGYRTVSKCSKCGKVVK
jgi:hypothetical protein